MAFRDARFPPNVSQGAIGGPSFLTDVARVNSGAEARDQVWEQELGRWEIGHNAREAAQYRPLQKFFRVMAGRAHSFRFKDWADFAVGTGEGVFVMLTSTTFQCYKRYSVGGTNYDRKILLPVSTITVTGGTVASVSYTTGVVTMTSGTPTSWTGEFDCLARFDVDDMRGEILDGRAPDFIMGWHAIPVIELRAP